MPPETEAVQLLRLKFKVRHFTQDMDPKAVWESEDTFKEQKLQNFRTSCNNMKKESIQSKISSDFPSIFAHNFLTVLNMHLLFYRL